MSVGKSQGCHHLGVLISVFFVILYWVVRGALSRCRVARHLGFCLLAQVRYRFKKYLYAGLVLVLDGFDPLNQSIDLLAVLLVAMG